MIRQFTWTDPSTNETFEYVEIDRGNGEYTSMLKSTYDELQARQLGGN